MKYKEKIIINKRMAEKINKYLTIEPTTAKECFGEDDKYSETVRFPNGYYMDIELCGVQFNPGESNLAWTQAVLYDADGYCVEFTEPCDEFFGEWELEDYDGNQYFIEVKIKE